MSTNLYKEAIAEAHQLRKLAEQSAKNKIIDALTPRIQAMVEAQLLAEDEMSAIPDFEEDAITVALAPPTLPVEEEEEEVIDLAGPSAELENDASVVVNAAGDVHFSVSDSLSQESKSAMGALINGRSSQPTASKNLAERNNLLRRKVRRLDALLKGIRVDGLTESQRAVIKKSYIKLLDEVLALRKAALNETNNKKTRHNIFITLKEMNKMTRRRSSAIFSHLFEAEDGAMDEMEILIGDEDLEALGVEDPEEVELDLDALDVSFDMEGGEEEVGEEEEFEEEGGEEVEEEELELEEADHDELDEVYEIDESTLRREIHRLRRLREQEESEAVEVVDSFGGGDEDGDVIVDVNPDDLLNALADELGPSPEPTVESRRRRGRSTRRARSNRTSERSIREGARFRKALRENNALKRQLSEMNLFNAKLLYVNKLMQNRNVTHEQKRAIVEALDNAKTIREAKLVYQGLSRSLKKKSTLREGATRRVLGSASRPTRSSGANLNESGGSARWAQLAGIDNK